MLKSSITIEVYSWQEQLSILGEHLAEQLEELNMSAAELARQLKVPTNRITEILNGQRAVTGDTALRLGHFFGTSPEFWLNLQKLYELRLAEQKSGDKIKELPTLAKLAKKPSAATRSLNRIRTDKKFFWRAGPIYKLKRHLYNRVAFSSGSHLVEAAGVEPASANTP